MSKNQKNEKIPRVKGVNDILPADIPLWELLENTMYSILKSYGFQQIRTPIIELTTLFSRGLGEITDIVEKEMYSFTDAMNGDSLTLRPENTASIVRAVLEHNLIYDGPKRLWYSGPMFRHERPQRCRYRQFHQIGAEALGFHGPDIDAELIIICQRLWNNLDLKNVRLELNSIGNIEERNKYRIDLIHYFETYQEMFDVEMIRRLYSNPLRILDTKNPSMQNIINAAPKLLDYLESASATHFDGVQKILHYNHIPFTINPRLVRGIDYYNRTVFEWVNDHLDTQITICGGGRYDSLMKMFGGKSMPACGFAIGIERLLELMKTCGKHHVVNQCEVYLVHRGEEAQLQSFMLGEKLRNTGLNVLIHCLSTHGSNSFKFQMKKADTSGAIFAIIIGIDEVISKTATIKNLRIFPEKNQINIPFDDVPDYVTQQVLSHRGNNINNY